MVARRGRREEGADSSVTSGRMECLKGRATLERMLAAGLGKMREREMERKKDDEKRTKEEAKRGEEVVEKQSSQQPDETRKVFLLPSED